MGWTTRKRRLESKGEQGVNYYERISYNPENGEFRWAISDRGIAKGRLAGCVSRAGYLVIKVNRKQVRANRLAIFLSNGEWPAGEVDHINGDKLDNRLENLRVTDRAGNSQNRRKAHRDHHSCGLQGVAWNKQHRRWQAKIMANKVRYHIGYYNDPAVAHQAYLEAKSRLHINGGKN